MSPCEPLNSPADPMFTLVNDADLKLNMSPPEPLISPVCLKAILANEPVPNNPAFIFALELMSPTVVFKYLNEPELNPNMFPLAPLMWVLAVLAVIGADIVKDLPTTVCVSDDVWFPKIVLPSTSRVPAAYNQLLELIPTALTSPVNEPDLNPNIFPLAPLMCELAVIGPVKLIFPVTKWVSVAALPNVVFPSTWIFPVLNKLPLELMSPVVVKYAREAELKLFIFPCEPLKSFAFLICKLLNEPDLNPKISPASVPLICLEAVTSPVIVWVSPAASPKIVFPFTSKLVAAWINVLELIPAALTSPVNDPDLNPKMFPLAPLMWELAVTGCINDVLALIVSKLLAIGEFKVSNEPDNPINVLLELIIPEEVICPNELTFKLLNDPVNPVIVPLALMFDVACKLANEPELNPKIFPAKVPLICLLAVTSPVIVWVSPAALPNIVFPSTFKSELADIVGLIVIPTPAFVNSSIVSTFTWANEPVPNNPAFTFPLELIWLEAVISPNTFTFVFPLLLTIIDPVNVDIPVWEKGPIFESVPLPLTVNDPVTNTDPAIVWFPLNVLDPVVNAEAVKAFKDDVVAKDPVCDNKA